ncbi:hypothetical protein GCM10009037_29430 [Halarchaeum grantii]|uniref:Uncharacterized protein n=1 Tax=Halarchaeum grantii TaxID=1193105 RepID=A0A830FDE1_9EURY|nr:hypothetical protein [Halarchaeum grantii]GGL44121.1 hypothetical protein GCM10009037_29430 [Halarchaeum grantii]
MGGLKKGTGGLNLTEDSDQEDAEEAEAAAEVESEAETTTEVEASTADTETDAAEESPAESLDESEPDSSAESEDEQSADKASSTQAQAGDIDMDGLPYLVQRQMRGASVNADRTKQLLLEVRPFVKNGEEDFLDDLENLVAGPVYKGDAREAAMMVAHEHPELVAEKLREWGIEYLDK